MGANITVVEVHPDRTDDEPVLSKASLTLRPAFTSSKSTPVALELQDEKIVRRSFDVNSDNEPAEEHNSEAQRESTEPETGKLSSWNGALILLVSAGAMFMDNVFITGTNISLSDVQAEFSIQSSELQWLISAYPLSFGGCLLLSGVFSDRYSRKPMLIAGLICLSIWTLAIGFTSSFIQMTVFRGPQGMGAALTIPSAVGIISSYFTGQDRTRALGLYAASGTVGFTAGLVLGGLLSSSLGWRYIFRLSVIVSALLAILGFLVLPSTSIKRDSKPEMYFLGASLSTAGLILLAFVLSGGGIYSWAKLFIIVLLILSVTLLIILVLYEKTISNPIMPLSLWKIHNFASLWVCRFAVNGSYQTVLYYTVLMSQQVDNPSPLDTAIRFIPSRVLGFVVSLATTGAIESIDGKYILITGLLFEILAPLPTCLLSGSILRSISDSQVLTSESSSANVIPTSFLSITGVSIAYLTCSTLMLINAPMNVKSLCGGMINTAYQIGVGVSLAIPSAVVQGVNIKKGHNVAQQYTTSLWCTSGIA
ncbi:hypothetical protein DPV78_010154 [Talaromyces pinophilus]|nr:hypothetical protein DPV78_010154 [Talaromyces pinophilus]